MLQQIHVLVDDSNVLDNSPIYTSIIDNPLMKLDTILFILVDPFF